MEKSCLTTWFMCMKNLYFSSPTQFFLLCPILMSPWFLIIINFINEFDLFDFTLVVAMDQINGKGLCVTCIEVEKTKKKWNWLLLIMFFLV
jgi:hypothetical protein